MEMVGYYEHSRKKIYEQRCTRNKMKRLPFTINKNHNIFFPSVVVCVHSLPFCCYHAVCIGTGCSGWLQFFFYSLTNTCNRHSKGADIELFQTLGDFSKIKSEKFNVKICGINGASTDGRYEWGITHW